MQPCSMNKVCKPIYDNTAYCDNESTKPLNYMRSTCTDRCHCQMAFSLAVSIVCQWCCRLGERLGAAPPDTSDASCTAVWQHGFSLQTRAAPSTASLPLTACRMMGGNSEIMRQYCQKRSAGESMTHPPGALARRAAAGGRCLVAFCRQRCRTHPAALRRATAAICSTRLGTGCCRIGAVISLHTSSGKL